MSVLTATSFSFEPKKSIMTGSVLLINILILGAIFYLFTGALQSDLFIFSKLYYKKALFFTITQAVLSSLICTLLALWVLPSLFSKEWKRKEKFYWSILNLPYFTPSLIGAFAIISIFGQSGLISSILAKCNIPFTTFIYSLNGIMLAHMFFYLPVTIKNLRRSMDFFPEENARLAQMLGMSRFRFWFTVVLPFLRADIVRIFALVCLYCLRSFTTVLILGGGALKTNTLEVALFQAIHFESNPSTFAQIALSQFLINSCFFAMTLTAQRFILKNNTPSTSLQLAEYSRSFIRTIPFILFISIALGVVFFEGLFPVKNFIQVVSDVEVIICCIKNLGLGLLVCFATLAVSFLLIHGQQEHKKYKFLSFNFEIFGYYTLLFSPLVIASSFVLLLQKFTFNFYAVLVCILIMQVLSALPSVYRLLASNYTKQLNRYDYLCATTGISGFRRFVAVDWPILKPALGFCVASIVTFSLGDARSFLFFNVGDNTTLVTLLFERIKSYHFKEAAAIATFILLLCYIIFYATAKLFGGYKNK